jgi:hypothetical protein
MVRRALCSMVALAIVVTGCGGSGDGAATGDEDGGVLDDSARGADGASTVDGRGADGRDGTETGVGAETGTGTEAGTETATETGAETGAETETGKAGRFTHPGILVTKPQLDFVKAKIAAGAAPWKDAFVVAKGSRFGALTYAPAPRAIVECGSYSTPDYGCSDEKNDATAAYTHALLWWFTGDEAYAKKSAEILNAWADVLKDHTNSNAPLQSAWVASVFPRAAEILKATYPKFAASDAAKFGALLRTVYLPKVVKGSGSNGNWELSMIEATISIGVYLDDEAIFDGAVAMWRKRVPAYIYLTSDGPTPIPPAGSGKSGSALDTFWYDPGKYVDGLGQETCRDFGHLQLGFAAMIDAAETARIQGVDLYAEESKRITKGLEYNAQYLDGVPNPGWLCGGTFTDASATEMWEIALNEYATRLKMTLPHTASIVSKGRPTATNHHMVWETLTHADVGSLGLPP